MRRAERAMFCGAAGITTMQIPAARICAELRPRVSRTPGPVANLCIRLAAQCPGAPETVATRAAVPFVSRSIASAQVARP